jgi:hypothetical protein
MVVAGLLSVVMFPLGALTILRGGKPTEPDEPGRPHHPDHESMPI